MIENGTCHIISDSKAMALRSRLVQVTLDWENYMGVPLQVTGAVSELDAALLVGMREDAFCTNGKLRSAVARHHDFIHGGIRYQVTASRSNGKMRSKVTLVKQKTEEGGASQWDRLIWIRYNFLYVVQEAWEFRVEEYRVLFKGLPRLSPSDMRKGRCLAQRPN